MSKQNQALFVRVVQKGGGTIATNFGDGSSHYISKAAYDLYMKDRTTANRNNRRNPEPEIERLDDKLYVQIKKTYRANEAIVTASEFLEYKTQKA